MSTKADKAFLARQDRRAFRLSPELAKRELAAYELVRRGLSQSELVAAIESGLVDQLTLAAALSDEAISPAFAQLRLALDQSVLTATRLSNADLPKSFGATFDLLNPNVIRAARTLDTAVIDRLIIPDMRETFRQTIIDGLEDGLGTDTIARNARASIGLAPNQQQAVRNFNTMLKDGNREALTRTLRDKRFDKTLNKALGVEGTGLSSKQVETMTDAYRRRMIAHNAKTHARTAAVDAQKLGQRVSWQDAVDKGLVDPRRMRRTWTTVGDGKVRDEHVAMNGETVGFNERFSNGDLIPGESTFNCRCAARVFLAREEVVA